MILGSISFWWLMCVVLGGVQGGLSALAAAAQPSLTLQMNPQVAAQIASQMSSQLAMQLQSSAEVCSPSLTALPSVSTCQPQN